MGATTSKQKPVVLETKTKGSLTGLQQCDSSTGKLVCTRYTGIPYALPPTGDRRWRRPVPLPKDFSFSTKDGQAGDYTKFGNVCPQPIYRHGSVVLPNPDAAPEVPRVESEDCLYLNIWVPGGEPPVGGWPVQFFIRKFYHFSVIFTSNRISDGGWLQVGDAMQNNQHDPFDLLKVSPRIIVSPTYRLNLFGFLCGPDLIEDQNYSPGNYGFWDQRLALEWTAANIVTFNGNPDNISVGGLSAGAYSTIFQLHYDLRRPSPSDRLIKRIFLYSNAIGIQPNPITSPTTTSQFTELITACGISPSLPAANKLAALRSLPALTLVSQISNLQHHTFRASSDNDFISTNFLSSITNGTLAQTLRTRQIPILLGEVANEELLYRLVNPASSYNTLIQELENYYPPQVVTALLKLYDLPSDTAPPSEWCNIGAHIIADCQVHATIRGWASCLLEAKPTTSSNPTTVTTKNTPILYRYRISWRAPSLDKWLAPSAKLCHAADIPIWWQSGRRAGYTDEDISKLMEFLEPFEKFLKGEEIEDV